MDLPRRLTTALQTLSAAVDRLDAAAERRRESETVRGDLEGELAMMQEDRMRLAGELGRSLAHAQALLAANSEVSARLDRVASSVRALAEQVPVAAEPEADEPG